MTTLAERIAEANTVDREQVQQQQRANRERTEEQLREKLAAVLGVTEYEVATSPVFGVVAWVEGYTFTLQMDGQSLGLYVVKTCPKCGEVYAAGSVYAINGDPDEGAACLARVLRQDYKHRCDKGEAWRIARSIERAADEFKIPVRVLLNTVEEQLGERLAA